MVQIFCNNFITINFIKIDFLIFYLEANMFKNFFDLKKNRTLSNSFIFYIENVILCFFICFFICSFLAIIYQLHQHSIQYYSMISIGRSISMLYCLIIALCILKKKKLYKNIIGIILLIISTLTIYFFGTIIALIPISLLTTLKTKN